MLPTQNLPMAEGEQAAQWDSTRAEAYCSALTTLLFSWERNVHAHLGYFPEGFRDSLRASVASKLESLKEELAANLRAVEAAIKTLKDSEAGADCS